MPTLADRLVPDQLWQLVEPLLPSRPPHHHGGRPRQISDRACFAAVVFMGRTSTPWELLPARELGCGSYSTAYRRFSAWTGPGCSTGSACCCSTSSARPAGSTGA